MTVLQILTSIWNHPFNRGQRLQGLLRFIKWQALCILQPYRILYPLTEKTVMIAEKGMTGVTGCIYNGLLEFEDMFFLLHFLRPSDLFIDIGANVGVYTVLSSGQAGAETIAIEPVKKTFNTLKTNVCMNNLSSKVTILHIGVGEKEGELFFSSSQDTVNHVLTDLEKTTRADKEKVSVDTLDRICARKEPTLIKIDVEGFETDVINGGETVLQNPTLKAMIIELNGSGSRYGYDERLVHEKLLSYGFHCYQYEPYSRTLLPMKTFGSHNTLYLRDLDFIQERIKTAEKTRVINKWI